MEFITESMKLEGKSNYLLWAYRMELVFMYEGLWEVIEPSPKPASNSIVTSSVDAVKQNVSEITQLTRITTMEAKRWISEGMKLEGQSNYIAWADRMKHILMLEGVWDGNWEVEETSSNPASEKIVISPVEEVTQTSENEAEIYSTLTTQLSSLKVTTLNSTGGNTTLSSSHIEEKQIKAMVLMAFSVRDRVVYKIKHLSDPAAVWKQLKAAYESAALFRRSRLEAQLMFLKLSEGRPLKEHFKNIRTLLEQLADVGGGVDNSKLVEQIIISLPPSLFPFGIMLLSREPQLTSTKLERLLLQEESRRITEFRSRGGCRGNSGGDFY